MAETSTAVIASANNLSVKYGTQVVLDGATIAFTEGEHIGLVGRNGSGKSTFLHIAAGLAQADSGEFRGLKVYSTKRYPAPGSTTH